MNPSTLRTPALLLALILFLPLARAADLPPEFTDTRAQPCVATSVKLETPWKPEAWPIVLPVGDAATSRKLALPAFPRNPGQALVMRFRARMGSVKPGKGGGGWNPYLQIFANDQHIGYSMTTGAPRVLNRSGATIRTSHPSYRTVGLFESLHGEKPALCMVFSNDWTTMDERILTDRKERFWYLFDVSDLLRADGPNTLTFTNTALKKFWGDKDVSDLAVIVDSLEIGAIPQTLRGQLAEDITAEIALFKPALEIANGAIAVAVDGNGALRVTRNGEGYTLRSTFSEPGAAIRFNGFSWKPTPKWTVTVSQASPEELLIKGKGRRYTVTRAVRLDGAFLKLRDAFVNTSAADVGILIRHDLIADAPGKTWRLCGLKEASSLSECAENPTAHITREKSGLGAAVIDSFLRAEMTATGSRQVVSLRNDHFALAKGDAYTADWSLYAGGPDFWEFVNAVRTDWNVNHTIPGMWSFWRPETGVHQNAMKTPEALAAYLDRQNIDLFATTPWFEYYYLPTYWQPRSVYKDFVTDVMKTVRKVRPQARFMPCLESCLYYAPLSFFKGTLKPLKRGTRISFDWPLPADAAKIVEDSPWKDSVMRNEKGEIVIDRHYANHYSDLGVNLKLVPTPDNHWHKTFMDMLDYTVNQCGMDGVYIDCFSMGSWRTYGQWDGHSAEIDPATGRITKKYASWPLISRKARRQWITFVTDQGKTAYTNGAPCMAELQGIPGHVSFMEAEYTFDPYAATPDAPRAAKGMLDTCVALGVRPTRYKDNPKYHYAEVIHKAVIAYLRYGMLYCHYYSDIPKPGDTGGGEYGILNYMAPFTPVELHEGWVIGRERIITTISRGFHWPHAEKPACKRFNLRGMPVEGGFTLARNGHGWDVTVSLSDWRETAVIMAEPVN